MSDMALSRLAIGVNDIRFASLQYFGLPQTQPREVFARSKEKGYLKMPAWFSGSLLFYLFVMAVYSGLNLNQDKAASRRQYK